MPAVLLTTLMAAWGGATAAPTPGAFDPPWTQARTRWDGAFDRAPTFQWRVKLPGPPLNSATHAETAQPVVHGDVILIGSAAGTALYMLNRRDGRVIRELPAAASVESRPAIEGEVVVFSDTGGSTWCYRLDGELVWRHQGNAPVLVEPTIHAGAVFVTNVDDLAVALDMATGELIWRYRAKKDLTRVAELALYAAPAAVVLDDGILLGFSDGTLVNVEAGTGEERWSKRVGEGRYPDLVAEPVAHGTDIYTSGYYKPLVALDRASRNVRWRLDVGAAYGVVVDSGDKAAIVYHPGSDGTLRAVNALTGAEKWAWDSEASGALTSPALTAAGLIVGSSSDGLFLIDADTGEERWRFHEEWTLQGVSANPVIAGRQLLFATNAGYLYSMLAIAPRDRPRELWD